MKIIKHIKSTHKNKYRKPFSFTLNGKKWNAWGRLNPVSIWDVWAEKDGTLGKTQKTFLRFDSRFKNKMAQVINNTKTVTKWLSDYDKPE